MLLQKLCCVVSTMICVRRRSVVKYFQGGEIVQLWWQWNVVTEGVTPSPLLEIIGQSLPEMLLGNLFFTWLHNKNSQILDFLENLFEPAQICPWEWLRIFRNFTWNDDVKSFFALWGRVEWAGAELNDITHVHHMMIIVSPGQGVVGPASVGAGKSGMLSLHLWWSMLHVNNEPLNIAHVNILHITQWTLLLSWIWFHFVHGLSINYKNVVQR